MRLKPWAWGMAAALLMLGGCDQVFNQAGAQYLKISLKKTCGAEDKACMAAVEQQFDACQARYAKEWNAYMNALHADEEALLAVYSKKMYACIVDSEGQPYFVFKPG